MTRVLDDQFNVTLPGNPDYVSILRNVVAGVALEMGVRDVEVAELKVAVTEACNHLMQVLGRRMLLEITCRMNTWGIDLTVCAVKPVHPLPAHGMHGEQPSQDEALNLGMMRAFMDEVDVGDTEDGLPRIRLFRRFSIF